jgi:hypothetical protein
VQEMSAETLTARQPAESIGHEASTAEKCRGKAGVADDVLFFEVELSNDGGGICSRDGGEEDDSRGSAGFGGLNELLERLDGRARRNAVHNSDFRECETEPKG